MINANNFNNINYIVFKKTINIIYYIILAAMLLFLIGGIIILLIPESNFLYATRGMAHIQLKGMYDLYLKVNNNGYLNLKASAYIIAFAAALILFIITIILHQLRKLFDSLVEKKPFDNNNSIRITIIGICLIISGFVFNAVELIVVRNLLNQINNNTIKLTYSPNLGLVLTGFLVIILASIFKYGTFLQNEYDSTI